jgi:hypothetical protein
MILIEAVTRRKQINLELECKNISLNYQGHAFFVNSSPVENSR